MGLDRCLLVSPFPSPYPTVPLPLLQTPPDQAADKTKPQNVWPEAGKFLLTCLFGPTIDKEFTYGIYARVCMCASMCVSVRRDMFWLSRR